MACFKIYTHIQCILIQMAAIFYYVTVSYTLFGGLILSNFYSLDPIVLEIIIKRFLAIFWWLVSIMILLSIRSLGGSVCFQSCVVSVRRLWSGL